MSRVKEGGWREGGRGWWPTFDAESKFAKIPNSHVQGEGGGGWRERGEGLAANF